MTDDTLTAAVARREPQAATDGPAADPIADLCARARLFGETAMERDLADALERIARERDDVRTMLQTANRAAARLADIADKYKWQVRDTCARAERAEAERDALRADADPYRWMRENNPQIAVNVAWGELAAAIAREYAARAKVKDKP